MDIWTKIFLLNWMALIVALGVDMVLLNDALQKTKVTGWLLGLWCWSAVLSAPVWIALFIIRA